MYKPFTTSTYRIWILVGARGFSRKLWNRLGSMPAQGVLRCGF